jgi:hypothetical protein
MKEWHLKHLKDTIIQYLTGIPENATRFQLKLHRKYGNITSVRKKIEYDLKHGVTKRELELFLSVVKVDESYSELRKNLGFLDRLYEIESAFAKNLNEEP